MATPETKSFAKKLGYDIVTFKVGAGNEIRMFTVHKNILCEKAPHFDTLFNGPFLEGQTQVAVLDEDDPNAFELFVSWIYQDEIEIADSTIEHSRGITFVNLFVFAEKYNIITLADLTMDFFLKKFAAKSWLVGPKDMTLGYQKTHAKSKLRLFLARTYVYVTLAAKEHQLGGGWAKEDMRAAIVESEDLWNDTFDMMKGQSGKRQSYPATAKSCDYHQHGKEEQCPYILNPAKKETKAEQDARILKEQETAEANLRIANVRFRNMFPELSILQAHDLLVRNNANLCDAADQYVGERQGARKAETGLMQPSKRRR